MSERRKVVFSTVSAIAHPEYYRGDRPCVAAADVPEEHWHQVEREGDRDSVEQQYEGLIELERSGELIRDVVLLMADEPEWRPVEHSGGDQ